jgi:uncharacterized protein (DUF4415 family)/uncharacterized DUF497 family protein
MSTRFEWDPVKSASNLRMHGVSFEIAIRVFADPFALTAQDRIEDSEQRWQTLGARSMGASCFWSPTPFGTKTRTASPSRSFASFPPERPTGKKRGAMSKKFVRHDVDLANLPPLTEKQKAELAALAARPNAEIDAGDIPSLTEAFWSEAVRGRFYKPIKTSTTVRIDADVLAWLRAQGKGYQSRINAILRREMLVSVDREVGNRALRGRHNADENRETARKGARRTQ